MLKRQLENEEWDILSIVTDPVLLGEFLRNTADGSPTKEEWPKQRFAYRWYQKDLLTDTSEFISLVAGRAVGKCSPPSARILVYPFGYVTINDLLRTKNLQAKHNCPTLYCIDPDTKQLVQRRFKITGNGYKPIYRVTTKSNHIFEGTGNHPILTQRGYIMLSELDEDDVAAVATRLPHLSNKEEFCWEEMRWFGYAAGYDAVTAEMLFTLKYQQNVLEMQRISKYFDARMERMANGQYRLRRRVGPLKHYVSKLLIDNNLKNAAAWGFRRVPIKVKSESLSQNKLFLEALFSSHAAFSNDNIVISFQYRPFALDIQEMLLRFSVESRVEQIEDRWVVSIEDYWSYYQFFQSLDIPGVGVKNLRLPLNRTHPTDFMRFDEIANIELLPEEEYTFAITVQDHENYISDNLYVHNSLVLEDKIIYDAVNVETQFPSTKESLLVTPNVAQMTPILDRLILRLGNSFLLKDFLRGNINKSKGTMDFPLPGGSNYRIHARIAGSKGENNMVPIWRIDAKYSPFIQ